MTDTDMEPSGPRGAADTDPPDGSGRRQIAGTLEEARAQLAQVDELPVHERGAVLAAVNERLVAELATMDEA